jgi:hypothetical protein
MLIVMSSVLCALWRNSWAWIVMKPSLCAIILLRTGIVLRLVSGFGISTQRISAIIVLVS